MKRTITAIIVMAMFLATLTPVRAAYGDERAYQFSTNYPMGTAFGQLDGVSRLAQNAALYCETQDHPDERSGYSWRNLLVYTVDGVYTFTYGGDINSRNWFAKTANGYEKMSVDSVREWVTTAASRYSDTQKFEVAKTHLFRTLEEQGFMPEEINTSGNSVTFSLFGGLSSELPAATNGYTGSYTLAVSGALVIADQTKVILPSEFVDSLKTLSSQMTMADKKTIATAYVQKWAAQKGYQTEVSTHDNDWTRIKVYVSSNSYYKFIVGGKSTLHWYNESNGTMTEVNKNSVDKVIR